MRSHLYLAEQFVDSSMFVKFNTLSSGEVSIILQFFQIVGVLLGLSLRLQLVLSSSGALSDFPLAFCRVLVGDCSKVELPSSCDKVDAVFTNSLLLAMRAGIVSVYPEVMLKMMKAEKFYYMICRSRTEIADNSMDVGRCVHIQAIQELSSYSFVKTTNRNEENYYWNRNVKVNMLLI